MRLTKEEKAICKTYGAYDSTGHVSCNKCPLVIDRYYHLCKANATKDEWKEYTEKHV